MRSWTPRGREIRERLAIVEADAVTTSHDSMGRPSPTYPQELQNRDFDTVASRQLISDIAQRNRPEFLGASPHTGDGAPLVGEDGIVEAGNHRVRGLAEMYDGVPAKAAEYRAWLAENATGWGMDPAAIAKMRRPILVRVRETEVPNRVEFADELNKAATSQRTPKEQAIGDARLVTPEMLDLLEVSDDGNITGAASRPFVGAFSRAIPGFDEAGRTAKGTLNAAGASRIRNAIFARAYGASDEALTLLEQLASSVDPEARHVITALLRSAPGVAKLRAEMEGGRLVQADPFSDLVVGAGVLAEARESGQPVATYIERPPIASEAAADLSPLQKRVALFLDQHGKRSPKPLAEVVDDLVHEIRSFGDPSANLLPGIERGTIPAGSEMLEAAIAHAEQRATGKGATDDQSRLFSPGLPGGLFPPEALPSAIPGSAAAARGRESAREVARGEPAPRPDLPPASEARPEVVPPADAAERPVGSSHEGVVGRLEQAAKDAQRNLDERAKNRGRGPRGRDERGSTPLAADLLDYATIGAYHIAKGVSDFGEWSRAMLQRFGERVRPHLKAIFTESQRIKDSWDRPDLPFESKAELPGGEPPVGGAGIPPGGPPPKLPFGGGEESVPPRRPNLAERLKGKLQRNFTSRGDLPQEVFDAKIRKDGWFGSIQREIAYTDREFQRLIKATYGRSYDKLSPAEKAKLDAVYKGEAVEGLPDEMRDVLRSFREQTDTQSRHMVQEGVVEGPLAEVVSSNEGTYARRSYRVFDDPKWADKVPADVRNRAKSFLRAEMPGASDGEIEGLIEKILHRAEDGPIALLSKGSKLGSKDLTMLVRRKGIAPEIRALMGEHHDPLVNYARSVTGMAQAIANHRFLKEVRAAGLGKFLHEEPAVIDGVSYRKEIAGEGSSVLAPLNGLHTTPEIEQAFRDATASTAIGPYMKTWMRGVLATHVGKTVLAPASQIRNFLSNGLIAVRNGYWHLGEIADSVRVLAADLGMKDDAGMRMRAKRLVELGVLRDSAHAYELQAIIKATVESANPLRKPLDLMSTIYRLGDDFWKGYGYLNELARYRKALPDVPLPELEERVAKITRNVQPTASMAPRVVQKLRASPLIAAFPTWPAEIIRTWYNTISLAKLELTDASPGVRRIGAQRLAGMIVAATAVPILTTTARYMTGIDRDDEKDARRWLAPWSRNSSILWLSREPDNSMRYVDLSYTDPDSYFRKLVIPFLRGDDMKTATGEFAKEALGPFVAPEILTEAVAEIWANRTESGLPVYNAQDDTLGKTEDIAGHLWKAIEPGFITSARRIEKAREDHIEDPGRKYNLPDELVAAGGFRVSALDVPQALFSRARDYEREHAEARRLLTSVANRRGKVSEAELKQARDKYLRARRRLFDKLHADVQAAIRLGLTVGQARSILSSADVSRSDVAGIASGIYREYRPDRDFLSGAEERARALGEDPGLFRERRRQLLEPPGD